MTASAAQRVTAFVDLFNAAVRSGSWDAYVGALADNARVEFPGHATYTGPDEVAAAYLDNPPEDTITVLDLAAEGTVDIVTYAWDSGEHGDGTMRISWTPDGRVAELVIEVG